MEDGEPPRAGKLYVAPGCRGAKEDCLALGFHGNAYVKVGLYRQNSALAEALLFLRQV